MTNRELETRYMQMKLTWKNLINANVSLVDENKDLKEEIERLNNIINEALGIANERFNYYHHTNKKEILEDWENIFNVLLRRDNE